MDDTTVHETVHDFEKPVFRKRSEGRTKTELYQRHYGSCKGGGKCRCPWWIYGWINGKKIRASLQTNRADIAASRRRRLEDAQATAPVPQVVFTPAPLESPAAPAAHPLEELIGIYLRRGSQYNNLADNTLRGYRGNLDQLVDFARRRGVTTAEQVTTELIDDFLMSGNYKPRSRFSRHGCLHTFFKFCVNRKVLAVNPTPTERPRIPQGGAHRPLTAEEQRRLLIACDRNRKHEERPVNRAIILTLLATGLRSVDVRLMRWRNIDFQTRTLRILPQKTRATRVRDLVIPNLPLVMLAALRALPRTTDPDAYIFGGTDTVTFHRVIKGIFKRADVKGSAHDTRVTFAVSRLAGGASLWEVSQLLGHSSTVVTERYYIKWIDGFDERLARVMGNADFSHLEKVS